MKKFAITLVLSVVSAWSMAMQNDSITQHSWEEYDWVDTCTTKYAVVHDWIGRCGIYDLEKHENLTELEYHQLYYSQDLKLEDGTHGAMFYGGKGRRDGVVSVSPSGAVMTIMKDNDDAYYSLEECLTIDKRITKLCEKTLKKNLEKVDSVLYAEVLVMDTQSGHIKAWVALQDEFYSGKFAEARPRRHGCAGDTPRETDCMKLARGYYGLKHKKNSFEDWTTKKVDITGDHTIHLNCCPTLFDDNAADIERWHNEGFRNYDQVIFTGFLPSDNPRYTICVVMDKKGSPAYGKLLGNTVNKLAEYLNKH